MESASGATAGSLNHDCKIDWLELNPHATHLLFRDKKQQLHLFNLITQVLKSTNGSLRSETKAGASLDIPGFVMFQERISLLSFCSYVQWVPDSDVVVAQVVPSQVSLEEFACIQFLFFIFMFWCNSLCLAMAI